MFEGYDTRLLPVAFLSIFLLELVLFHNAGWSWSSSMVPALVPITIGLAFFSHRVRKDLITIALLSSGTIMLVSAFLIATGAFNASIPA